MKQLLLIFICVLSVFNAKAQDTSYLPHGLYIDTLIMTNDKIQADTNWSIYYDTIPVIMLVSDTSEISLKMLGREFSQMNNVVWQQRGYTIYGVYYTTIYLDENKQPLDKNIIVWMSMPTESTNRKYIGL